MAVPMKLFCVLILFSLLYKGNCQCSVGNIKVSQSPTGSQVLGKTQWRVTISNNCGCSQLSILLDCVGYQTVENVDPAILNSAANVCLFNSGRPLLKSAPISFTYAWDNPYPFTPLSSTTYCG
ncbi:uncharacterized protein LOC111008881 isoform X2 [Momordica charantia]|uniref:Uncharacterized protein LOC111008881 isoform X2 n=1 Tax=Momordica charantia TaxID=3673 RepID=A0A6J1C8A1_MOMCH|nr:uncharacterized protein LOC111008881 isoform X2 [Momordica charantia]